MKKLMLLVLLFGALSTAMHAATKADYQPATIVSVESRTIPSPYAGDNPSDAPLQAQVYSYEIGFQRGDTIYRTSYVSSLDDLPSVFANNQTVNVDVKGKSLYVEFPGSRPLQMAIEKRTIVKQASSTAGN